MAFDIYSTATMLKAIEVMPPEYTFLADTFARDGGTVETEKAFFDTRKGTKKMAPFVHKGTGGALMGREGFQTLEFDFSTIAPERVIESAGLQKRMFGENVMGAMTPEERQRRIQAQDLVYMRKSIQRRQEWMVYTLLHRGIVEGFEYTDEGRNKEATQFADFGFSNVVTPLTKWDQAGAKIDDDMQRMYDLVYDGCGAVELIIVAPDVYAAMRNNEKFMKQYDYRRADFGQINAKYRGQGVRYIGTNSDGVDMVCFSGTFIDDDGLAKPFMPSGRVVMGSRGMFQFQYGPIDLITKDGSDGEYKWYIKKQVPERYASVQSKTIRNRLTSRPFLMPDNVDGWALGNVL